MNKKPSVTLCIDFQSRAPLSAEQSLYLQELGRASLINDEDLPSCCTPEQRAIMGEIEFARQTNLQKGVIVAIADSQGISPDEVLKRIHANLKPRPLN